MDDQIAVEPCQTWYIARWRDLKATGSTETEALAHLLLDLRNDVRVVTLQVEPLARRRVADRSAESGDGRAHQHK